jgi:hypothetical protein
MPVGPRNQSFNRPRLDAVKCNWVIRWTILARALRS